jgi:flagellar biosynthesis protein FlhA
VTQIPALIVSTSAGIIVSRAGAESNLGQEVISQILYQPRAIGITAIVLFGFGMIPGLPLMPFWILAALAGGLTYIIHRATKQREQEEQDAKMLADASGPVEQLESLPILDILAIEVGYGLFPWWMRIKMGSCWTA